MALCGWQNFTTLATLFFSNFTFGANFPNNTSVLEYIPNIPGRIYTTNLLR